MAVHNVLLLTTTLDIGGEQLSTMALAKGLMGRGHRVTWWSSGGPLLEEVRRNGIPYVPAPPRSRGLKSPLYVLRAAFTIRPILRERQIDVIHSQTVLPALAASLAVRRLRPRPRLIFHDRGIHRGTYGIIGRPFNCLTDLVIANSHDERSRLLAGGLRAGHCRTIHNGLHASMAWTDQERASCRQELGLMDSDVVVGTVGRLSPEKGQQYLLEAAARLRDSHPAVRFALVGGGRMEDELRAQRAALGLGNRVIFTGVRRDLRRLYAALDIVAVPSTMESFGNVVLEAWSAGRPVIASRVGGMKETLVDGVTGLHVPPGDPAALSEAIRTLVEHPATARRLADAGHDRVERYFTIDRVLDEVEEVYDELTRSAPTAALSPAVP